MGAQPILESDSNRLCNRLHVINLRCKWILRHFHISKQAVFLFSTVRIYFFYKKVHVENSFVIHVDYKHSF